VETESGVKEREPNSLLVYENGVLVLTFDSCSRFWSQSEFETLDRSSSMTSAKIRKVAVIGAGNQGPKIAYRCTISGIETVLYDKFSKALDGGKRRLMEYLDQELSVEEAAEARTRLGFTLNLAEAVEDVDLVIEAVPENVSLKRQVWSEIDALAPLKALICTNSSCLPCSRLADATSRPEKAFNVNFSDPVHDDLVEVMKGVTTSDETFIAAIGFIRSLKMVAIVTYKEIMGFSFNRIWRAVKREALHLVDEGFSNYEDVDRAWMLEFGTPYGPFGLMDIIGLDVVRDIEEYYYQDSRDERDTLPKLLHDMIAEGRLGVKSGRGFYEYPNPAYKDAAWLRKQGRYKEDVEAKLKALRRSHRRTDNGKKA
jgi:3-hydroxybutyryl-CoA dehydrogenase